ncbi:MAG: histidine phosphatase family protein [Balneola sp.]
MKHLYIVRHGETEFNKLQKMQGRGINASLNDKGRVQAASISEFLKEKPITKIVTSSLNRAMESAQPLSALFDSHPENHADLDEMNFGILEGKPFEDVKQDLQFLHNNWSEGNLDIAPDDGESPKEVFDRANAKVLQILKSSKDEHVVFVVHGRLIRILLSEWLGLGLQNMHKIEHQNGAINHLRWANEKFEAVELNIISHLEHLLIE